MAAKAIAERGHEVIILERRRAVGIPVQCGEFLPAGKEISDMFPHSPRMARLVEIPRRFTLNRTSRIRLVSPREHSYEFDFESNIIDRRRYDAHLAERAVEAGAELSLGFRVIARESKELLRVKSSSGVGTVSAKVIVGADGPVSLISRSIGNPYDRQDRDLSLSLHRVYSNADVDPRVVEMIFGGRAAPGGYGWTIPRGNREANVGIGVRKSMALGNAPLKSYLDYVVRRVPGRYSDAEVVRSVGALIPVGGPVAYTTRGNTVIVGDAAGHVMATNGGGIPTALCGGEMAGEAVSSHLENGTPLNRYDALWQSEFGTELRASLAALRLADRVMGSDSLTEVGMALMRARFLEPIIRCRLPLPSGMMSGAAVSVLRRLLG